MTSACQQLLDLIEDKDCFNKPHAELLPLQLKAAQDLFAERRTQLRVLDRRARETRVEKIEKQEDIVPLLFAHTTYKSYPQSFIQNGQWERMTKWLGTLSVAPMDEVDDSNVADIDEWLERLWAAGHEVNTTSGTSGKVSILNRTQGDDSFRARCTERATCWPNPPKADCSRHFFMLGPRRGPYLMMIAAGHAARLFARPDSLHYLSEEPLRVSHVTRMAEMRRKMADGSATLEEIAAHEQSAVEQAARVKARFEEMADAIVALRREPMYLMGPWAQLWAVMEKARALGIQDGEFHPETVVASGGDLKGAKLPPDFREQLHRFFGKVHLTQSYGMSEMSYSFPRCEAGNYHQAPWIMPLLLDREGERMASPGEGVAEGRFAFLDLSFEGRWGGLISGDKVSIDYRGRCPCGRDGIVVLPDISRYNNLGEEDKIGCAGTIDSYIRGALAS